MALASMAACLFSLMERRPTASLLKAPSPHSLSDSGTPLPDPLPLISNDSVSDGTVAGAEGM